MHRYQSFVALGDSFTEGLNDSLPDGTFRGWADRLAEIFAKDNPEFRYANLALRGKMLNEIVNEQIPTALTIRPDVVTLCAGGNDLLVPGGDVDAIANTFATGVAALRSAGIDVVIFTGPDTKPLSFMNVLRGKIGIYNAHLWAIAEQHGAKVVDLWAMGPLRDRRAWSDDRLHFTAEAHRRIALRVAEVIGLTTEADWRAPWSEPDNINTWVRSRRADLNWTATYLVPWIRRQLRGESLGDGLEPKRPELEPYRNIRS